MASGIYVETLIRAPMEEVWRLTQSPDRHARWDLRFSEISNLPRPDDNVPQRFRYSTRIGFGLQIDGEGESVGTRGAEGGERTSSLKFWSEDPRSLIRKGSGYWQYIPTGDGVRFLTWYDYETRFGAAGRLLDRVLFRPLMGWATAWSFDRLRLWLEKGADPGHSALRAATAAASRAALAFAWIYQGLVPKLLFGHQDELTMLLAAGVPPGVAPGAMQALGVAEVLLGLAFLVAQRSRWPFVVTALLMAGALIAVAATAPAFLVGAFNPVSLNTSLFALSVIGYVASEDVPRAMNCRRDRPERTS